MQALEDMVLKHEESIVRLKGENEMLKEQLNEAGTQHVKKLEDIEFQKAKMTDNMEKISKEKKDLQLEIQKLKKQIEELESEDLKGKETVENNVVYFTTIMFCPFKIKMCLLETDSSV